MQKYLDTHDVVLQQNILELYTQLIKYGVDFIKLDKNHQFLQYVIHQALDKNCYLSDPLKLLPSIFDFLGALFIIRKYAPEV